LFSSASLVAVSFQPAAEDLTALQADQVAVFALEFAQQVGEKCFV